MPPLNGPTLASVKCVVIGDLGVGTTSLLMSYEHGEFPTGYLPIDFDIHAIMKVDELTYNLNVWDRAHSWQEDADRMRPIHYPGTDIFLICFSVAEPASFKNVKEKWVPEFKRFCPDTPFILLGTKVDLRGDRATLDKLAKKQEKLVSKEEGKRMAESVKAATYLECSALTQEGVKNLFDEAIRQTATWQRNTGGKKKSEKKKCNLLRSSSIQFFKKKDIQIKLCFVLLLPAGNY